MSGLDKVLRGRRGMLRGGRGGGQVGPFDFAQDCACGCTRPSAERKPLIRYGECGLTSGLPLNLNPWRLVLHQNRLAF